MLTKQQKIGIGLIILGIPGLIFPIIPGILMIICGSLLLINHRLGRSMYSKYKEWRATTKKEKQAEKKERFK